MDDCIFCKIVKGEIPSKRIYEDDYIYCFLDAFPKTPGHLLVIPKEHYENIFETPDEILEKINVGCKKIAKLLKEKLGASGVNVINASGKDAGQVVYHIHYHVVPRYRDDNINLDFHGHKECNDSIEEVYEKLIK